ncbi:MAG: BrnT family toxin [Methylococcaceae bacterium]
MEIEFDPKKHMANLVNSSRRLGFDRAHDFDWATASIAEDVRHVYPERRFVAVGYLDERLHVLCFTSITGGIRVISFRKANQREAIKHGKPITLN